MYSIYIDRNSLCRISTRQSEVRKLWRECFQNSIQIFTDFDVTETLNGDNVISRFLMNGGVLNPHKFKKCDDFNTLNFDMKDTLNVCQDVDNGYQIFYEPRVEDLIVKKLESAEVESDVTCIIKNKIQLGTFNEE